VIQTVALVASLPRSLAIDPREVLPPEGLFISRLTYFAKDATDN
jgi:hypothetical protein